MEEDIIPRGNGIKPPEEDIIPRGNGIKPPVGQKENITDTIWK